MDNATSVRQERGRLPGQLLRGASVGAQLARRGEKQTVRVARLLPVLIVGAVAAGCGGSSAPPKTVTATRTVTTDTARLQNRANAFIQCVRAAGFTIKRHVASTKGRVPQVTVPADYLGAAVQSNGALVDLWLAHSPSDAQ